MHSKAGRNVASKNVGFHVPSKLVYLANVKKVNVPFHYGGIIPRDFITKEVGTMEFDFENITEHSRFNVPYVFGTNTKNQNVLLTNRILLPVANETHEQMIQILKDYHL